MLSVEARLAEVERELDEIRRRLDLTVPSRQALDDWAAERALDPADFETVPPPALDAFMTVRAAADALGVGEEQTRRLLRAGELAGIPRGGRGGWRVWRTSVERLARERDRGIVRTGVALPDPPRRQDEAEARALGCPPIDVVGQPRQKPSTRTS